MKAKTHAGTGYGRVGLVEAQADVLADARYKRNHREAIVAAVALNEKLAHDPEAARKLGGYVPLTARMDAEAKRLGVRNEWNAEHRAFSRYVRSGAESRDLLASAASGSYLLPAGFLAEVLFGVRFASGILNRARLWRSPTGSPATYPLVTGDVSTNAATSPEATGQTDTNDPAFTRVSFGQTPIWRMPGLLRASRQLVADAAVPIESMVTEAYAWRLSRAMDAQAVATMEAGVTQNVTTAANTGISYSDVIEWLYALDLSARGSDSAAIVVHPLTSKALAKLADTAGRPLLVNTTYQIVNDDASIFGGQESRTVRVATIAGVPIIESQSVAAVAPGAVAGIFVDFDRALVFRFVEAGVVRLDERFADFGEVGYAGFARCDLAVGDATTAATLTVHS